MIVRGGAGHAFTTFPALGPCPAYRSMSPTTDKLGSRSCNNARGGG